MIVKRVLYDRIKHYLFKGKAIIIYGARQVGKTTLVKQFIEEFKDISLYLNADEPDIRISLTNKTSTELKNFIGGKKLVIIDEAQRIKDIGITIKLIVDNFPDIQIIATGSSSFDISQNINEPLTGRKYEFFLFPFSCEEISFFENKLDFERNINQRLIYGSYPEVVLNLDNLKEKIKNIAYSYAYKDVLNYQRIKKPEILDRLLTALSLQIGCEVSYTELASHLSIDKVTIESYIKILEDAFIIFRLPPFSRNLRNELKKLRKIYFYDNGIRNAFINNFNSCEIRNDVGRLWENYIVSERIKYLKNHNIDANSYFWRTRQKQEIDYIEVYPEKILAREIKWSEKRAIKPPKVFIENYSNADFEVINTQNYRNFLGVEF